MFWVDGLSKSLQRMPRLMNSFDSAWSVIDTVLSQTSEHSGVVLAIQRQLVDEVKKLQHTDAGQELFRMLEERGKKPSPRRDARPHPQAKGSEEWKNTWRAPVI